MVEIQPKPLQVFIWKVRHYRLTANKLPQPFAEWARAAQQRSRAAFESGRSASRSASPQSDSLPARIASSTPTGFDSGLQVSGNGRAVIVFWKSPREILPLYVFSMAQPTLSQHH
jgi:hypothetical protein